ncbi:hypothetical protein AMTRI_Chr01g133230 [Amborella trichopoda]
MHEINMKITVVHMFLAAAAALQTLLWCTSGLDIREVRALAARHNVSCVLIFGDSTVDPGNNNFLSTDFKGNFVPYGRDFAGHRPTGRLTNGKLPTDFIAEFLGLKSIVPAFLERGLTMEELVHGVSFASAASGYDDFTANITNVMPFSKQIEYLRHYKAKLAKLLGVKRAQETINNAVFIVSAGTNDFIQDYYIEPQRSKQFTVAQYQDFLANHLLQDINEMYRVGGRRFAVVGVPPLGCLPLVKTLWGEVDCVTNLNEVAVAFNRKINSTLTSFIKMLGPDARAVYFDIYSILLDAVKNPMKYGFTESSKGCCGTGMIEFGQSCKGMGTCKDPSKYVFWDSVHPTERMYHLIASYGVTRDVVKILV